MGRKERGEEKDSEWRTAEWCGEDKGTLLRTNTTMSEKKEVQETRGEKTRGENDGKKRE